MENACHTNINQKAGCITILYQANTSRQKLLVESKKGTSQ